MCLPYKSHYSSDYAPEDNETELSWLHSAIYWHLENFTYIYCSIHLLTFLQQCCIYCCVGGMGILLFQTKVIWPVKHPSNNPFIWTHRENLGLIYWVDNHFCVTAYPECVWVTESRQCKDGYMGILNELCSIAPKPDIAKNPCLKTFGPR